MRANPMATPVLELVDVTLVRGGARVLDRVSLTIPAGEHTAIVGPNGSGKSALVGLIAQHERPLAGHEGSRARVLGRARWDVFELRTRLGFVSADLHHRFVQGNSEGRIRGADAVVSAFFASQGVLRYGQVSEEMRQRAGRALARLGAAHLADRRLHEMSSGEVRRVLLARALVHDPEVLVLDEPTSGLDLVARHRFLEQVRGLARDGTTLVLVTHHVEEVVPEIARVVLLKGGRVAGDGPKRHLLTPRRLGELFDAEITVEARDGYYHVREAQLPV
jgi:iron complex transport system ATP-binding protein